MWRHQARAAPKIDTAGESPDMPRIQCTNCGKNFEVPQQDVGGVIVCAACGGRIEPAGQWGVVKLVVEKDLKKWRENLPEGAPTVRETVKRLEAVASVEHGQDGRGTQITKKNGFGSAAAWAIGVVLVVMAIGLPFLIAKINGQRPGDYGDLMGMQRKAEALAAGGSLT